MEYLSSLKNPRVQLWHSLLERKGRRETGLFLVEGRKLTEEILTSDFEVEAVLLEEGITFDVPDGVQTYQLSKPVFTKLCETQTPQGVITVAHRKSLPMGGTRWVALDGVQDPGNVGTIIRTADAAGFDAVLLSTASADPFSPKVLRSTMGSLFRMPVETVPNLAERLMALRETGWEILSSQLDGEPFYARGEVKAPYCLIIGSEGNGVSPKVQEAATRRLRLPMQGGAESLNAAVAAGIMMYDLACRPAK